MHAVLQRLRYLRNWELANVVLIPGIVALMWRSTGEAAAEWQLRWIGVIFVSYLLLQGGSYWHLKLRMLSSTNREAPTWFAPLFSLLRRSNPVLMIGAAVFMLATDGASTVDRAWALALLGFAYVEHINYYVRQLMHDTPADLAYLARYRRLRHSPLRRDLDAVRAVTPTQRSR